MLTNFVKNIRNIMRNDAGINGDAQRIEQIAWMLFLKVYDEKENDWEFDDDDYHSFIPEPCRWRNWAKDDGTGNALTADPLLDFVNNTLFPTLKNLEVTPETPMRSAIVRTTFEDANQYMKDGVLLRQLLNVIDQLDLGDYEESHAFGEIYESILKEMQSAGSAGEFYTPRALTDFMADIIQPQVGERMADFACGTGGFITSWLKALDKKVSTAEDKEAYARSVFGIEKKQFPYMLCVTNLLLHDIDSPHVLHDNSLSKDVLDYGDDDKFDVVLMNPPYGGSEKQDIKQHFPSDLCSSETADLFMVLIMYRLAEGGRAAVILPDGFLFGTDNAKLAIKEKLLRDFNLHTIIRLPGSIFSPYTSIATNILFFNNEQADGAKEGFSTRETWFYRLDMPEGYKHFSKTKPMLVDHCKPIRDWWTNRQEIVDAETGDEKSRRFTAQELLSGGLNFDQCKFPKDEEEILRPEELLRQYHDLKDVLDKEIETIVSKVEALLDNKETKDIQLNAKKSCDALANLVSSIPERLKKSILQEAIEGRLVPQDPNDEPASVLLERIRAEKQRLVKEGKLKKKDLIETPISDDEKPFDIPVSWEWVRINQIATSQLGKTLDKGKQSGKECPYLCSINVYWEGINLNQVKTFFLQEEELSRYKLQRGDLLICEGGDYGRCAIWDKDDEMYYQNALHRIRFFGNLSNYFYKYIFEQYRNTDYIVGQGQTIKHFTYANMCSLLFPLPPLAEQKRIVEKIEELFKHL